MDIVIIGVGGQGTLLASRVLGAMAISDGLDVKVSEVHGMSQRGGSVVTYVRSGKKVESPIIENATGRGFKIYLQYFTFSSRHFYRP